MVKKRTILDLGTRERQVYEAALRLGGGTVNEIVGEMIDPPTYTTVRVICGELVKKGLFEYRNIKNRYYYKAKSSIESAQKSVLTEILGGFFRGRASDVALTLLEVAGETIPLDELDQITAMIEKAKKARMEAEEAEEKENHHD